MKLLPLCAFLFSTMILFSQIQFLENAEAWNLADNNSSWGLSMIDYDNDGLLDIFVTNGFIGLSQQNYLMHNLGTIFQSVTSQYNLIDFAPTTCASWGDFDNDGFIDLFTTNGSESTGANRLYRFDGNTFSDVSAEYGMSLSDFYNSVSFCNVNGSNFLDIFILGTYTTNYLYVGNENSFLNEIVSNPEGTGYTNLFTDISGDNKPELLLANSLGNLIVYSYSEGEFTNITSEIGLGNVTKVSGLYSSDMDNDGDFDLVFATNLGNTSSALSIFRNDNGVFLDVTTELGVNISGRGKCVVELDADKDGLSDFFLGRWNNTGILLHNLGNSFEIVSDDFSNITSFPISLVAGDVNNNGKQDIYQSAYQLTGFSSANLFWENHTESENHFVKVKLKSEFAYLNSIVKVYTNENTYKKELRGNDGSFNQIDELFFGISSDETIEQIGVIWSNANGEEEIFSISPINEIVILEQNGSVSANSDTIPASTIKLSAFPNPFNPVVTISFNVPQYSEYEMTIFNLKGQKILTNKGVQKSNETIEFVWNAEKYASGLYFCAVKADNVIEMRKMILLK